MKGHDIRVPKGIMQGSQGNEGNFRLKFFFWKCRSLDMERTFVDKLIEEMKLIREAIFFER